jgi:hypothetical protein
VPWGAMINAQNKFNLEERTAKFGEDIITKPLI